MTIDEQVKYWINLAEQEEFLNGVIDYNIEAR